MTWDGMGWERMCKGDTVTGIRGWVGVGVGGRGKDHACYHDGIVQGGYGGG